MTNEEYLKSLSTADFAHFIETDNCCECCIGCENVQADCEERIVAWLKQEHPAEETTKTRKVLIYRDDTHGTDDVYWDIQKENT